MTPLRLPNWLKTHLYANRTYADLSAAEVAKLAQQLRRFRPAAPEVSVVIPAWNEGDNIFRTLSSLAATTSKRAIEVIVINNNSTDHTQQVLDALGVLSYSETRQGIAFARQRGLEVAQGRYHLCADADTFYPPRWVDLLVQPMEKSPEVVAVYGRYAFVPPEQASRRSLWFYEQLTGVLVHLRRRSQEFINVLGFTMGFRTDAGHATGGFYTEEVRVFDNAANLEKSEDGFMALNLSHFGRLQLVSHSDAVVFTSPRKVLRDGSFTQAVTSRLKLHIGRLYYGE